MEALPPGEKSCDTAAPPSPPPPNPERTAEFTAVTVKETITSEEPPKEATYQETEARIRAAVEAKKKRDQEFQKLVDERTALTEKHRVLSDDIKEARQRLREFKIIFFQLSAGYAGMKIRDHEVCARLTEIDTTLAVMTAPIFFPAN